MENNPVCRLCLKAQEQLEFINGPTEFKNIHEVNKDGITNATYIKTLIPELLFINVKDQFICRLCHNQLRNFFIFREDCLRSLNLIKIAVGDGKKNQNHVISLKDVVSHWKNYYNTKVTNEIIKKANLKEWFGFVDETDSVYMGGKKWVKLDDNTIKVYSPEPKHTTLQANDGAIVLDREQCKLEDEQAVDVDQQLIFVNKPVMTSAQGKSAMVSPSSYSAVDGLLNVFNKRFMTSASGKPTIVSPISNATIDGQLKVVNKPVLTNVQGKSTITSRTNNDGSPPLRVKIVKNKQSVTSTQAITSQTHNAVIGSNHARVKLIKNKPVLTSTQSKSAISSPTRKDTIGPDPLLLPDNLSSETSLEDKKFVRIGREWIDVTAVTPVDQLESYQSKIIRNLPPSTKIVSDGHPYYRLHPKRDNVNPLQKRPRVKRIGRPATPIIIRKHVQPKTQDGLRAKGEDDLLSHLSVRVNRIMQSHGFPPPQNNSGTKTRSDSELSLPMTVNSRSPSQEQNSLLSSKEIKQEIDDASTSNGQRPDIISEIDIKEEPLFYEDMDYESKSNSEDMDYDQPEYVDVSTLPIVSNSSSSKLKNKATAEVQKIPVNRCSYFLCGKDKKNYPGLRLFHFPVNETHRCKIWVENSGNENLHGLSKGELKKKVLCGDHFEFKYFLTSKLASGAVPIKHPGLEEPTNRYTNLKVYRGRSRKLPNIDYLEPEFVDVSAPPTVSNSQLSRTGAPAEVKSNSTENDHSEDVKRASLGIEKELPAELKNLGFTDCYVLIEDIASLISDKEPTESDKGLKKQKMRKQRNLRKFNCYLCGEKVTRFSQHLKQEHINEPYVKEIFRLKPYSTKRTQLITRLRDQGTFVKDVTTGFVTLNPVTVEKTSCLIPRPLNFLCNDILKTSGFLKSLKEDDISLVGRSDPLICEIVRRMVGRNVSSVNAARFRFRRLARLLIEIRKYSEFKFFYLVDILHPEYFQVLIEASLKMAEYDEVFKSIRFPALPFQMGTLIKNATLTSLSLDLLTKKHCEQRLLDLDILIERLETDWFKAISAEAQNGLIIPSKTLKVDDVKKFDEYLTNLMCTTRDKLRDDPTNSTLYHYLQESIFCKILVFNRQSVQSLQGLLIVQYFKDNAIDSPEELYRYLTKTEKTMQGSLDRIVMLNTNSPILFDKATFENLNFLLNMRVNFDLSSNPYLFGLIDSKTYIDGFDIVEKLARLAFGDEYDVNLLLDHQLRNELATITQILRMNKNELQSLALYMGFDRFEFHSFPDNTSDIAKVAKLLSLSTNTFLKRYKGVSLDQIEIRDLIVEQITTTSVSPETTGTNEGNDELEKTVVKLESKATKQSTQEQTYYGMPAKRVPWTAKQKKLAQEYFENHIKRRISPRKQEVLEFITKYPEEFKDRCWKVIKVYVYNRYNR